jgi:HEAT repeat protein
MPLECPVDRTVAGRLAHTVAAISLGALITLLGCSDAKPAAVEVKESEGERETAGKTAQSPHPESGGPKPATDKRLEDMSVAELVAMLRSENPQRRSEAARRLGELGPQAAAARVVLVELLDDPHEAVVVCAAQALASIEKPGPDLIVKAIEKLRSIDENAIPRMPTMVALGPNFSGWEYSILQLLAAAGVSAVNPLKACLQNEEWLVRAGAARALGAIGPDADSAVPALAAMVNDPQLLVRCGALLALGQIGSLTEITVPLLEDSLCHAEPLIRAHAAAGLGELGAAAEPAVLELVTLTKDPNVFVRRAAGQALVNLGPHAKSALPDLISRLRNRNSYLGSHFGLHKSGYVQLAGGDAHLKIDGFPEVLQAIGPAAVPLLMEALRDESLYARSKAAEILGRMALDDPTLQRSAVLALGKMGPEAKDAVPALQKLGAARSLNDRTAAREALKRITGDN